VGPIKTIEFDIKHRLDVAQILFRLAEKVLARKLLIQLAIALSPAGMARDPEADQAYKILINVTANWKESVAAANAFYDKTMEKVRKNAQ
jgi:hypothetical protein